MAKHDYAVWVGGNLSSKCGLFYAPTGKQRGKHVKGIFQRLSFNTDYWAAEKRDLWWAWIPDS